MNGAEVLAARGVDVTIAGNAIVRDAELTLTAGELIAIVGPNGAGKSTLVRAVAGLQRARGRIEWLGTDLRQLRGRKLARIRAFVPQRARVPDGLTARDAVQIGRSAQLAPLRRATRADHAAADEALERAGVARFADRRLTTLSGGELQRVQIAVALAQGTPALLADEPTSHLDLGATVTTARLLRSLADDGLAVLLVLHDLSLAAAIADRVVVMSQGRTVATGAPAEVLDTARLAAVWQVHADLRVAAEGRTALEVAWLDGLARGVPAGAGGRT